MIELLLTDELGQSFSVNMIRYFQYKNNKYFMYTLMEKDERNYIKIYIVKVMRELDTFVSQTIRRTDEWLKMKSIVKRLLDETRAGLIVTFKDLDYQELEDLIIFESREFKLSQDLVEVITYPNHKQQQIDNVLTNNTLFINANEVEKLDDTEEIEGFALLQDEIKQIDDKSPYKKGFDEMIEFDENLEILELEEEFVSEEAVVEESLQYSEKIDDKVVTESNEEEEIETLEL